MIIDHTPKRKQKEINARRESLLRDAPLSLRKMVITTPTGGDEPSLQERLERGEVFKPTYSRPQKIFDELHYYAKQFIEYALGGPYNIILI